MATDVKKPVLLVDDSRATVQILRKLLAQIGFRDMEDVPGGAEALERMRSKKFGLVISDWNMEPMSGIDLLVAVRNDPLLKKTPFIIVTGDSRPELVISAKRAGVDNYIVKPFTADTLQAKIDAAMTYEPARHR
jgi:two-component system chemotaxis response regulator CheY